MHTFPIQFVNFSLATLIFLSVHSAQAEEPNLGVGPVKPLKLEQISLELQHKGKAVFDLKCAACHKIDERLVGPALKDITTRRAPEWIMNMILNPLEMTQKDPTAKDLFGEYLIQMTFQDVTEIEARSILEYLRDPKAVVAPVLAATKSAAPITVAPTTPTSKKSGKKGKVGAAATTVTPNQLNLKLIEINGSNGKDIVEIAVGSPDHSTLATAVVAADLVSTLTGPGPYTIFAPKNSAFAKLPAGTVETLLKPENKEKLASVLQHHAAAPAYYPEVLSKMTEVDMVDGPKLKVTVKNGDIYVNDVKIEAALKAKNGVVYIVDTIL